MKFQVRISSKMSVGVFWAFRISQEHHCGFLNLRETETLFGCGWGRGHLEKNMTMEVKIGGDRQFSIPRNHESRGCRRSENRIDHPLVQNR